MKMRFQSHWNELKKNGWFGWGHKAVIDIEKTGDIQTIIQTIIRKNNVVE